MSEGDAPASGPRPVTTVYVLNGPNLNLIGAPGPDDGPGDRATLADVESRLRDRAGSAGVELVFLQTNHEGDLVDWIQEAGAAGAPVILSPGGYAHTSVALHDAIRGSGARVVEVHLSNTQGGESFRRRSYVSPTAAGIIQGFGTRSYDLALDALLFDLKRNDC